LKKKKIIYVISNIENSLGFEWLAQYTDTARFDAEFIFLNANEPAIFRMFRERGVSTLYWKFDGKRSIPFIWLKLILHFIKIKPDIVHAHLFEASLAGMAAAWCCRIPKRIYTRHHSILHHAEHPSVVKYDKLINYFSTKIVAVTQNVATILKDKEGVSPEKITVVHHGFRLDLFQSENIDATRIIRLKEKWNPQSRQPVVGVISRYVNWKGIQYIIPAFKKLLEQYPEALLLLANAKGNYQKEIGQLLTELPDNSYVEIEFENDIFALYRLFDVFIHVPVGLDSEAFGQIYVETMAAAVPVICTQSGVSPEFVVHDENAWVVAYRNSDEIYNGMIKILSDKNFAEKLKTNALKIVTGDFSVEGMMYKLEEIYSE
jgi:glycosyltransferase involved in cell wall biosynthesis